MYEGLMQLWTAMQQANTADPQQGAAMLAQMGDPGAIAPLFQDAGAWSPVMMEPDSLLNPAMPSMQARMAQAAGGPIPQVPMGAGAGGQGQPVPGQQPGLTAEQYKMLMGQMPDQRGNFNPMSAPGVGRAAGLQQPQMLQNAPVTAGRRPSLADLIYGGR
jgi:hypothetical protein